MTISSPMKTIHTNPIVQPHRGEITVVGPLPPSTPHILSFAPVGLDLDLLRRCSCISLPRGGE